MSAKSNKVGEWFSAEIRAVYFEETRRGTTPHARNRATYLANRESQRERQLRSQIRQEQDAEPEDLLRDWLNKK
jgi:hypothetical protein